MFLGSHFWANYEKRAWKTDLLHWILLPFLVLHSGHIFQAPSLPGCHKTLYFHNEVHECLVRTKVHNINWFAYSLKVFFVVIRSYFSVTLQSTSVLHLVQDWQNVLSIPFATNIKSISRDPSSDVSSVPLIRIFLLCALNLPWISQLLLISKTFCFIQGYINIDRVKMKFTN